MIVPRLPEGNGTILYHICQVHTYITGYSNFPSPTCDSIPSLYLSSVSPFLLLLSFSLPFFLGSFSYSVYTTVSQPAYLFYLPALFEYFLLITGGQSRYHPPVGRAIAPPVWFPNLAHSNNPLCSHSQPATSLPPSLFYCSDSKIFHIAIVLLLFEHILHHGQSRLASLDPVPHLPHIYLNLLFADALIAVLGASGGIGQV